MSQTARLSFVNLMAILACIVVVMAPHAPHVPKWTVAFCLTALLIRGIAGWQRKSLPAKWLLIVFAGVAIAGVLFSYRSLFGRESAVTLLLAMTVLKLLEMNSRRDITVVVVLCYFLTITNFFYTQTIFTALYSLAAVWLVTGTMVSLEHRAAPGQLKHVARVSGTLLAQAVPVMLVLFVLFPRVDGPLWGLPRIQNSARTGLSDDMSPGAMASLSLSDEIAFRASFAAPSPDPKQLYWRGPVLWDFDGRTWRAGQRVTASTPRYESLSPTVKYSVTLEPHDRRWMFLIDLPVRLPEGALLTRDYQVMSIRPVRQRLRYDAESAPRYRFGEDITPDELQRALALPPGVAPRTRAMVSEWNVTGLSALNVAQRALRMYRDQPFTYTLEPPLLLNDPVDQFLFDTRRGFCEHFASSFAVIMRAAGVPTRIVTGYLGGEINPVDRYLVVRQSEAHAWNEIWVEGEGWIRIDPTAAVSPARIERGVANAVPDTDAQPLLRRTHVAWLIGMRHRWDAVTNAWNQWVLGYSPDRQRRFLSSFGLKNVNWRDMIIALMVATAIVIGAFSAAMFMRLRGRRVDPVQRLWLRYCAAMAANGIERKRSEGPKDFTARAASHLPVLRDRIERIGNLYIELRYGVANGRGPSRTGAIRELAHEVKML